MPACRRKKKKKGDLTEHRGLFPKMQNTLSLGGGFCFFGIVLRGVATSAPTWLSSGCCDAGHQAMAMAIAAVPEHPALIAHLEKQATGAKKEEVKGWGGDLG